MNNNISDPSPLKTFEDGLEAGVFRIQQCKDCGKHIFYPRVICTDCGSTDLKWIEPSGRGVVYSTCVVRRKPERGGNYNVALIDLEEGPRMMGTVADVDPEEVAIGMEVSAHVGVLNERPAVIFYNKEQGDKEW